MPRLLEDNLYLNHQLLIETPNQQQWIRDMLARVPLGETSVNHEVALLSRTVDLVHQDSTDRFIAATALVYDLVLVTADKRRLASEQVNTIPC